MIRLLLCALAAAALFTDKAAAQLKAGDPFPLIHLPLAGEEGGKTYTIERYRGRKLMLHLFASW